jgi:hypothetical protein
MAVALMELGVVSAIAGSFAISKVLELTQTHDASATTYVFRIPSHALDELLRWSPLANLPLRRSSNGNRNSDPHR